MRTSGSGLAGLAVVLVATAAMTTPASALNKTTYEDASLSELLAGLPEAGTDWLYFYRLAQKVRPGDAPRVVPALLEALSEDDEGMANYIGMVLDRMAPASVGPVAEMLSHRSEDWYHRWAAANVLEMMAPAAKAAIPALERTVKNRDEDLDVRIAAARALGAITGGAAPSPYGTSTPAAFSYYRQITGAERGIVDFTRKRALQWRTYFMEREARKGPPESGWSGTAWWNYAMSTGINMDMARSGMKASGLKGGVGSFMDVNFVRPFVMCHSKSTFYRGRLTHDVEEVLKRYFFKKCDGGRIGKRRARATALKSPASLYSGINHNIPMNFATRDYLSLGVLKDDPAWRDKMFKDGVNVRQRYELWNDYWKSHLKHWALKCFWIEHASSNYEWHNTASYFNLVDLSADPEVRKLATMFVDLALLEHEQMTITNQRGGSKSRAKRGGLGSTFNPYIGLLYGERGRSSCHAPAAAFAYTPPPAAILLHKLGSPIETYEIANQHYGGKDRALNYAWVTPEYIMGGVMIDPGQNHSANTQGRWSGVIFRDLSAIELPSYSKEKWCVQHKDVMISQRCLALYYGGDNKVTFQIDSPRVEKDGWIFVSNGEAFGAVKVLGKTSWKDGDKVTLAIDDDLAPIIIQVGRPKVYRSFENFQRLILAAPLTYRDDVVRYRGPNSVALEFPCLTRQRYERGKRQANEGKPKGVFALPKINGKTIEFGSEREYVYQSPFMELKRGSEVVTVRYGGQEWRYDFGKRTIEKVK